MSFLTKLERNFGWAAFPGLIRFIALFQLLTLGLTWVSPNITSYLYFDYDRLMAGEVWRAFTFIFLPAGDLSSGMGIMFAIFAIFGALLLMTFGDGLEQQWGPFQTSFYVYLGWFTNLLSGMILGFLGLPVAMPPALLLDASILFAFAAYYPSYSILFMLILPVRISFVALLSAFGLLFLCIRFPILFPFIILALGNFFLYLGPGFLSRAKTRGGTMKRRAELKRKSIPEGDAFHHCESCGATEQSNPEREFRVDPAKGELCSECLGDSAPSS